MDVEQTFWVSDCIPCGALPGRGLLLLEIEGKLVFDVLKVYDEASLLYNDATEVFAGSIYRKVSKELYLCQELGLIVPSPYSKAGWSLGRT